MGNSVVLWDVYDNYRTARLNVKYYSARLDKLVRCDQAMEIVIAISAPGTVLAIWLLKSDIGSFIWQACGVIAAVTGIVKPFFKMGQKIKFFEQTLSGYRGLEYDLYEILLKIKDDESYSPACRKMFDAAMKKKRVLVTSPPENTQDKKLVARLEAEVIKENPKDSFYIPSESEYGN